MIQLTRLNGNLMVVNSDLIKYAEASPDTVLTLINGEKLMVLEECGEVVERVVAYRARLLDEVAQMSPAAAAIITQAGLASAAASLRAAGAGQMSRPSTEAGRQDEEGAQRRRRSEF